MQQARRDGILFDVGHGGGSFDYGVAIDALAHGFVSDVISTDLHAHSWDVPVESLPHTASKLLNLGVPIESIVQQCTANAAFAIGREGELGTLRVGTVADIAVFDIEEGAFQYSDVRGRIEEGSRQIEARLCVRAGVPYTPEELRDEVREDLERARFNKMLNGKRLRELGWSKA